MYENSTLVYFPMPEGRVLVSGSGTTFTQEFVITDQQGNARLSFQNNAGTAKAMQENSYYGFGMTMASAMTLPTTPNKRLYNGGSEWQNDYANNPDYYQTFYRNYDAALGRFVAVDPVAEASESVSVYHYAGNNPITFNDPNGDYQTNPFSPGFNQQVGNVWTNPNVNMGPTAGGLNPNLNYGGATGAGDNIFYYQLLAAASGGSSDAWKQYAALKGGKSIYQAYGNGKSTGVSKGSLRDYMEDIHINGIDPTGVTMLAEVTIREAGWKIQAEAYGSVFYGSANQGGDNSVYINNLKAFLAVVAGESTNNLDEARGIGSVLLNRTLARKTSFYDPSWLVKVGKSGLDAVGGKIYNDIMKKDINDLLTPTGGYKNRIQGALDALNNCIDYSNGAYFWNASNPETGSNWARVTDGTWIITGSAGGTTFMRYSDDDSYGRVYP